MIVGLCRRLLRCPATPAVGSEKREPLFEILSIKDWDDNRSKVTIRNSKGNKHILLVRKRSMLDS